MDLRNRPVKIREEKEIRSTFWSSGLRWNFLSIILCLGDIDLRLRLNPKCEAAWCQTSNWVVPHLHCNALDVGFSEESARWSGSWEGRCDLPVENPQFPSLPWSGTALEIWPTAGSSFSYKKWDSGGASLSDLEQEWSHGCAKENSASSASGVSSSLPHILSCFSLLSPPPTSSSHRSLDLV